MAAVPWLKCHHPNRWKETLSIHICTQVSNKMPFHLDHRQTHLNALIFCNQLILDFKLSAQYKPWLQGKDWDTQKKKGVGKVFNIYCKVIFDKQILGTDLKDHQSQPVQWGKSRILWICLSLSLQLMSPQTWATHFTLEVFSDERSMGWGLSSLSSQSLGQCLKHYT